MIAARRAFQPHPEFGPRLSLLLPKTPGPARPTTIRLYPRGSEDSNQSLESSDSRDSAAPGSASLIRDLGENGSSFIDTVLGVKPSDMAEFERSGARPPSVIPDSSVVNSELWGIEATAEARGSFTALQQSGHGQLAAGTDSLGSELGLAITNQLARAARGEDGAAAAATPSQRKRPRPAAKQGSGTASFSLESAVHGPEESISKRSRIESALG